MYVYVCGWVGGWVGVCVGVCVCVWVCVSMSLYVRVSVWTCVRARECTCASASLRQILSSMLASLHHPCMTSQTHTPQVSLEGSRAMIPHLLRLSTLQTLTLDYSPRELVLGHANSVAAAQRPPDAACLPDWFAREATDIDQIPSVWGAALRFVRGDDPAAVGTDGGGAAAGDESSDASGSQDEIGAAHSDEDEDEEEEEEEEEEGIEYAIVGSSSGDQFVRRAASGGVDANQARRADLVLRGLDGLPSDSGDECDEGSGTRSCQTGGGESCRADTRGADAPGSQEGTARGEMGAPRRDGLGRVGDAELAEYVSKLDSIQWLPLGAPCVCIQVCMCKQPARACALTACRLL